ncbi:similar to An02g01160 [Aspergillus luchuensis IFO 4308]|nr:similar to An02g01160 [Aspergillus luchuensis IFO 4308]
MRRPSRFQLCICLLFLIILILLESHLTDLCDQYRAQEYIVDWFSLERTSQVTISSPGQTGDKVIVAAKLQEEQTEWIEQELPDWQRAIYIVNPSREVADDARQFTTPLNKGHESMAYLTYLIDHYDRLPSTIAFIHSHRSGFLRAWHVDAPLHDNAWSMRALQLNFVQQNGYVNLRCNLNPGCKAIYHHVTRDIFTEIFEGTSTPPLNGTDLALGSDKRAMQIPDTVAAACCAQFAVSREQVLQRPREDYIKIRQWIILTPLDDAHSGRVMEYLWHIIFGKEAVYCPDEEVCYCEVYGLC